MPKTKLLNIRIDPELKKKAKKLAQEDGRSLSNWVTKLIASKVEKAEKEQGKESWAATDARRAASLKTAPPAAAPVRFPEIKVFLLWYQNSLLLV